MQKCEFHSGLFDKRRQFSPVDLRYSGRPSYCSVLDFRRHYVVDASAEQARKSKKMLMYLTAVVFAMVAGSYAAVPLYQRFCQATGYGGTVHRRETVEEKIARHDEDGTASLREIVVQFNADVADGMQWKFIPTQREIRVKPGESALAFYTAENQSSTPITGVSTYNVTPMRLSLFLQLVLKGRERWERARERARERVRERAMEKTERIVRRLEKRRKESSFTVESKTFEIVLDERRGKPQFLVVEKKTGVSPWSGGGFLRLGVVDLERKRFCIFIPRGRGDKRGMDDYGGEKFIKWKDRLVEEQTCRKQGSRENLHRRIRMPAAVKRTSWNDSNSINCEAVDDQTKTMREIQWARLLVKMRGDFRPSVLEIEVEEDVYVLSLMVGDQTRVHARRSAWGNELVSARLETLNLLDECEVYVGEWVGSRTGKPDSWPGDPGMGPHRWASVWVVPIRPNHGFLKRSGPNSKEPLVVWESEELRRKQMSACFSVTDWALEEENFEGESFDRLGGIEEESWGDKTTWLTVYEGLLRMIMGDKNPGYVGGSCEKFRLWKIFRLESFESEGAAGVYGRLPKWKEDGMWEEFGAIRGLWEDPWAGGSSTTGGEFTWNGGLNNQAWARLDKFLVSPSWLDQFSGVTQSRLSRPISDHFPIVLEGGIEVKGSASYRLAAKMKEIKKKLKREKLDCGGNRIKKAKESYKKWVLLEEVHWRQLSREIWLREGDRNTGFFHRMASAHRRNNALDRVKVNGEWLSEEQEVREGIVNTFQQMLSEDMEWKADIGRLQIDHISQQEAENLEVPFTETEIHTALMEMNGDKAPTYQPLGGLYKLLAKVLANRLKKVIGKVVSTAQNAFVTGRQILDASLIANEGGCGVACPQPNSQFWLMECQLESCGGGILIRMHHSGAASGLRINLAKSEIIPVGEVEEIQELAVELGCRVGSLPSQYLGLPLGAPNRALLCGMEWKREQEQGWARLKENSHVNRALLGKWIWRFACEKDNLWKQVITTKYGQEDRGWRSKKANGAVGVGVWKEILKESDWCWDNLVFLAGKGTKIRFWKDIWCTDTPLSHCFTHLFVMATHRDATIEEMWDQNSGLLWRKIQLCGGEKEMVTSGSRTLIGCWHPNDTVFPSRCIWMDRVPTKVAFFAWEATWGKVLTLDRL
ncbi:Cytochrome c oxidase assembly protein COX11, mitochondrial [Vitis vinifera]|uniref:Cytochrome c oxidase assembly protein COX11, mitochondrial n=1 Tax=Vitis vinifera TaxID=29760 RepID=A0A438IYC4_VITVI|nr:Cytochrome c oxidase assembly protein COX11, mitochondrial [Vitis vinifera]